MIEMGILYTLYSKRIIIKISSLIESNCYPDNLVSVAIQAQQPFPCTGQPKRFSKI